MTRQILTLSASYHYGQYFKLRTGEVVEALLVPGHYIDPGTVCGGPLYLPVHKACLKVSQHFINKASSAQTIANPSSITSMHSLWEVLYQRMPGQINEFEPELSEPHAYYGAQRCRNIEWEPEDDKEVAKVNRRFAV